MFQANKKQVLQVTSIDVEECLTSLSRAAACGVPLLSAMYFMVTVYQQRSDII